MYAFEYFQSMLSIRK